MKDLINNSLQHHSDVLQFVDKDKLDLAIMGREFILKHTPEFLEYAVDYSMFDKFGFLNQEKDLPKKSD